MFRHVLLVGCTRSSMRCCTSYTIHINVPFITNDNYLFSIIRLFSSLLLLWDLVNNHLFDGRLFPFFGLLSRTHLSFIIPFCLRILLSSFLNDLLLFRWHNMFVIIFIWVSHPSLLFILCLYSWSSSNSFFYSTPLLILLLLLYLNSLLLDSLHCPCKVPKGPSPVCLFWWWKRWRRGWLISIVLLIKYLSPPRHLRCVRLIRLDIVERCPTCKVVVMAS